MEFHSLLTFVLFWFALQGSGTGSQSAVEMNWQSILPNTSMPKALHNLIKTGNKSTLSELEAGSELTPFRDGYGVGYKNSESLLESNTIANLTIIYFLYSDLHPQEKMMLAFTKSPSRSNFLPREIVNTIPFSSNKLSEILNYSSIEPTSKQSQIMKQTIEQCEAPEVKGEVKYCATSLESMVDFVVAKFGRKVEAFTNEAEENKTQNYSILKGIKLLGDDQIVCHKKIYVYAVYYCHMIMETKAYLVPLVGEDGSKAKAVVVCHTNTSAWNPMHLSFQVLNVKPGGPPICHFLNSDTIVWVPIN